VTPDSVTQIVERWENDPTFAANVTAVKHIQAAPSRTVPLPESLPPALADGLRAKGVPSLYVHQAAAYEDVRAARDTVVVTPAASGKTLCYTLPVLETLLQDEDARALFIFPTKALAQDQLAELDDWAERLPSVIAPATYDGDTPAASRKRTRQLSRIVITNPDMLHTGILPHHTKWARFFGSLRYVVIDEMHAYRGVFGSHFANVLRRLRRICAFYHSTPTFVCCSATIANPQEFAERLLEREVVLVDENGAPTSGKHFLFYNPPIVNRELGIKASYLRIAKTLAGFFLLNDIQIIVFATTRQNVELLVTYLREQFADKAHNRDFISGYRGGYLPTARRRIEAGLRNGEVRCVVATNALELGIDIGELDACVLAGYPGTIASTWQQAGRAGRRSSESVAVLVARPNPLDQFVITHPDYFFGQSPEHALINPDNLAILLSHVQCAAFELPFQEGELFGGEDLAEILSYLAEQGTLHRSDGSYHWTSERYPAERVSLRSVPEENFVVVDEAGDGRVIAEVEAAAAPRSVFEGAVYMAEGERYVVKRLDWAGRKAYVEPSLVDYYTQPIGHTTVKVLDVVESKVQGLTTIEHGPVEVVTESVAFKKIAFHTLENLGEGTIDLPPRTIQTTAYWFSIPEKALENLDLARAVVVDGVLAISYVLHHLAALMVMSDPKDLGRSVGDRSALWFARADLKQRGIYSPANGSADGRRLEFAELTCFEPTIFLYDAHAGGVGFSLQLYDEHRELLRRGRELVERCPCEAGCPSCVGPEDEVGTRGKSAALAILNRLVREESAGGTPVKGQTHPLRGDISDG